MRYHKHLSIFRRVRKIAKATISFHLYLSVRPSVLPDALNNSAPTRGIFMKFDN